MKLKVNFFFKPYFFFEIRFILKNGPITRGSYPLIGFYAGKRGIGGVFYPFTISISMMKFIKPTPLTEEELESLND